MDPLSDVLRVVRLSGAYFYTVEATAPWGIAALPARELSPRIMPDAEHLISYHILTSGTCWGGLQGDAPVRLDPGDVLVFPHGDAHHMTSAPNVGVVVGEPPARYLATVQLGRGAARDATFVCGFLGCDLRPFNPLLAALPRRLHMRGMADGWLAAFPRQVVEECRAGRVGGGTVLTRMAEIMFIEVVRRYIATLPAEQTGWLSGLRDPVVGKALALLHAEPARAWTLAELANQVAASRSTFAERFTHLVGQPAMQYLTRWRMQVAADLLARGNAKVSAVAAQVGYDSEAAFSRAFKRATGASPAEWRARRVGEAGSA